MTKINLSIPIPFFIEYIFLWFLLQYRKKRYGFAFRRIKLAKGRSALVDPDDYHRVSQRDWHLLENNGKTYAAMFNEGVILSMHRFIMNAPKGTIVDHKDHNGLNNTKRNLRFATLSQNSCNRKFPKRGTSKYRGVGSIKTPGKWQAIIYCNRKRIYLGLFTNEESAARAYDAAAKIYHGEFAMLNFPSQADALSQTA